MKRLVIETPRQSQRVLEGLYRDMERRIASSPLGLCPVDMALNFLRLCHAQTCGKCVPCRVGLGQLTMMLEAVLDGEGGLELIDRIEMTAEVILDTADCAIGYEAARMVLQGVRGFREDYELHAQEGRCMCSLKQPVPCVTVCPAHVDIPGYVALIREGRYQDAVRLIRRNLADTNLVDKGRVVQGDSLEFLARCGEKFDVIFLDPPYSSGLLEAAMERIAAFDILREHGIMVCESALDQVLPPLAAPYAQGKEYRYGKIKLTVYRRAGSDRS